MTTTITRSLTIVMIFRITPDEIPEFFDTLLRDIIKARSDGAQHKDFLQYFMDLKARKSASTDESERKQAS